MKQTQPTQPTLYVMVGLPASGKSTRAKQLEEEHRALRLTPDEWMIPLFGHHDADGKRDVLEGRFVWLAIRTLRKGINVVLDFGVWGKDERTALRVLSAEVGALCELIYLKIDEDEQRHQHDGRTASDGETTFYIDDEDLLSTGSSSRFQTRPNSQGPSLTRLPLTTSAGARGHPSAGPPRCSRRRARQGLTTSRCRTLAG